MAGVKPLLIFDQDKEGFINSFLNHGNGLDKEVNAL